MPTDKTPLIIPGTNIKSPCKDCPNRSARCHIDCVKYADYKAALEAEKEQYRASRAEEVIINQYEIDRKRRLKKYYKTKGSRKNERT